MEQVLDSVYAAAIDPTGWAVALESIVRFCGVGAGAIYAPRLPGVPPKGVERFLRYGPRSPVIPGLLEAYADKDCFSAPMMAMVSGDHRRVASVMGTRPTDSQLKSAYRQEYMRQSDIGDTMALMLRPPRAGQPTPVLGLHAPWAHEPISTCQIARLQALAPHLQRAARMLFEVAPEAPVDSAMRQAVDRIGAPTVLLRQDGRLAWLNAAAEDLATPERGLQLAGGRLAAVEPRANQRVQALIRRASEPGHPTARTGGETEVDSPDGRRVTCLVIPLGGDNPFRDGVGPCRAAVYLLAGGSDPAPGAARLRRLFGLSAAEAEVAKALMGGVGPEEIALQRGRSIETVRTQCRAILSKTGLSRVSELVRLRSLVSLPEAG